MEEKIKPLDISMSKCVINGKMMDVVDYEEYANNPATRDSSIGIIEKYQGEEIVLPYRGEDDPNHKNMVPGIYDAGAIDFKVYPKEKDLPDYTPEKIINFNNNDSMRDILEKEETLSRMNEPWITSPNNITQFPIMEEDRPEMICLKSALNAKHIDFDKYGNRFGDNFLNDKRQLKNDGVTLKILKRFCDNCDMEAILTLRDQSPNVPNPIGKEIQVSLTTGEILED